MRSVAIISLDCTNGTVRRYWRVAGNKPCETGRVQFDDWNPAVVDEPGVGEKLIAWLQTFRAAWTPPEEPGPRPTSPLRTALRAAA